MKEIKTGSWNQELTGGTYINPIIHADYSDPDVVRSGDDFFLVASSFNSMPGLPVLHSRDLVSWRLVNHVVGRLSWPGYEAPAHGKGIWAPSIRCRGGRFFVFFASPDEGVFMSETDDPFGRWSEPVCVKRAIGWIDPCPFWDDDGEAYLVNAFANSRIGFKSVLRLSRMKKDGTELLDEGRFVFDGREKHPTMEGPKLYKRNGWYYIFAPAGGVRHGWQTVLRSRSIWGPWEDRIVLHQGGTAINGPHQGGWVETAGGESWFVHFQDKGAYGRVVHLQPVRWCSDWPLIGTCCGGDCIGEPVDRYEKPTVDAGGSVSFASESGPDPGEFVDGNPGLAWQWQADPETGWVGVCDKPAHVRLVAHPLPDVPRANLADVPHVLSQKFPAFVFSAETSVELRARADGDCAGMTVLSDDYFSVEIRAADRSWILVRSDGGARWDNRGNVRTAKKWARDTVLARLDEPALTFILHVREGAVCEFACRLRDGTERACGEQFTARPGFWVGAKIGIYCLSGVKRPDGAYADFGPVRFFTRD